MIAVASKWTRCANTMPSSAAWGRRILPSRAVGAAIARTCAGGCPAGTTSCLGEGRPSGAGGSRHGPGVAGIACRDRHRGCCGGRPPAGLAQPRPDRRVERRVHRVVGRCALSFAVALCLRVHNEQGTLWSPLKSSCVPTLSLRGAQRRGNLAELSDDCSSNEIATLRSQ